MLAHVGGNEGVAAGQFVHQFDDLLGLDQTVIRFRNAQGILFAPAVDLVPPDLQRFGVGTDLSPLDFRDHVLKHRGHWSDDGNVGVHDLRYRRRIDVDMQYGRFGAELAWVRIGHAVVETRAGAKQHVAIMHRHVGFIGAMHAEHAEKLGV